MAVLLQYNTTDNLTVQQLFETTQVKMEMLVQVLQILLKAKLLIIANDDSVVAFDNNAGYSNDAIVPLTNEANGDECTLYANTLLSLFLGYKNKYTVTPHKCANLAATSLYIAHSHPLFIIYFSLNVKYQLRSFFR